MSKRVQVISLTIVVYTCCSNFMFGQQAIWRIGIERNLDVYKPYTSQAQKTGKQMHGSTTSLNAMRTIRKRTHWSWSLGLDFKLIHEKVEDYKVIEYIDSPHLVDQVSRSYSLGCRNELTKHLFATQRQMANCGIQTSFYFIEWFSAHYVDKDGVYHGGSEMNKTLFFPVSSVNAALFYRHIFMPQKSKSIAVVLRCGSNIYSDWDQFSRYAWIGFGLEIGFGKENNNKTVSK